MMESGRQESVSKQSSILKPTKQRQPLQCVEPNPTSSENSPTIKIKRRVSFARNKRIREFCNETEQGTVWDNTYEEHDSSSTKSNSTSGNDQPLTITVPCHEKENFPVQLFLQTDEIECKELPVNEEQDDLQQSDMDMDNSINNPNIQNDATIYCDEGMEMTTYIPSNIIAYSKQDDNFIENVCKNLSENESNQNNLLKNSAANSTDLTVAISQLLGAGQANKLPNQMKFPNISYNTENRINSSNTAPMEFTSVLPSSTWIRPNSLCQNDKNTGIFDNQTMEFTMAVPYIKTCDNQNTDKISNLTEKTKIFADKSMELTEAFPVNKLLQRGTNIENIDQRITEQTETMPIHQPSTYAGKIANDTIQDKTKIFPNRSVEITEAIPVLIKTRTEMQNQVPFETAQDKTEIFVNKSIEMTEAIPVYIENSDQVPTKTQHKSDFINYTKIFSNKSMEMTEAISTYNKNHVEVQERKKIFPNLSMETTEMIPNRIQSNKNSEKIKNEAEQEKNIVLNQSMEMTEAIPCRNRMHMQFNSSAQEMPEKTNIFTDKSMEMTETIPAYYKCHHSTYENKKDPTELIQDKTNIFANKSMEMTEAIPSYKSPLVYTDIEKLAQEKTIFSNKSMEMTAAIRGNCQNHQPCINDEQLKEKTKIFADLSMEMTEAIPVHSIYQSDPKAVLQEAMPEKIKVFADNSMEMTEAVPVSNNYQYRENLPQETFTDRTKIILNESMEMTDMISSFKNSQHTTTETTGQNLVYNKEYKSLCNTNKIQRKTTQRKSINIYNKPTDIIGPLASLTTKESDVNPRTIPCELQQERTKFFANESINITETIPIQQNIFLNMKNQQTANEVAEEKTRMFANNSMNISKTTPIEQNVSILKQMPSKVPVAASGDKTKFFCNKSMDITEAIPTHQSVVNFDKSKNTAQEKTKIFLDKSMDMTETIAIQKSCLYQKGQATNERPQLFTNNPSDLILRVSTIPANSNLDKEYLKSYVNVESQEPNTSSIPIYHDDSMEMTSGLPAVVSQAVKTAYNDENKKTHDRENSRSGNILKAASDNFNSSHGRLNSMHKTVEEPNKSGVDDRTDVNTKYNSYRQPYESTKVFHDASMEFTGLPPAASNTRSLSKKMSLSHNQSSVSNKMDPNQNSSRREENFHRITSDELNTLCASMNLPIQRYADENSSMQSNSIPSCSNVSFLRESLKNGTLFQQQGSVFPERNTSAHTPAKVYGMADGKDNSKIYSGMDFEVESTRNIPVRMDNMGPHENIVDKFAERHNYETPRMNVLSKLSRTPLAVMETDKTAEISLKSMQRHRPPLTAMEMDRTAEIGLKGVQRHQSLTAMELDKSAEVSLPNSQHQQQSYRLNQVYPDNMPTANENLKNVNQPDNENKIVKYSSSTFAATKPTESAMLVDEYKTHPRSTVSMVQECPVSGTVAMHNSIKISDHTTKSSCVVRETFTNTENNKIQTHCKYMVNEKPGEVEIYHDVSIDIGAPSILPSGKRKSEEMYDTIVKKNPAVHVAGPVCTFTQANKNSDKKSNDVVSTENNANESSLSRLPSDNTELLIATMGFKTELAYPLIISDKTMIKISQKPSINETTVVNPNSITENPVETNKTYVVDVNNKNQIEPKCSIDYQVQNNQNKSPHFEIPIVKSPVKVGPPIVEEDDDFTSDKENQEPSVKVNLFQERYSELEDIQPPSFLCLNSMDDDLSDVVRLPDDDDDEPGLSEEKVNEENGSFFEFRNKEKINVETIKEIPKKELEVVSKNGSSILSEKIVNTESIKKIPTDALKIAEDISSEKTQQQSSQISSLAEKRVEKTSDTLSCESENVIKKPISPFLQLEENMKTFEKRDDCIWSIRTINPKLIAVDFITKSLVLIIRLNELENASCVKDIENIEVMSRLRADSKNILLKIVHNLLLSKLYPNEMLEKFKLFEDVLPLLEYVSTEVIFAMNFMFDLEKLNALNLFNIDEKRILFTVASRKANIILKVSLTLKQFNEISPDDIDVICVLGDIRTNDIKQLIVNIRRDYKFLSRYIKDVKDYITLMEESSCFHKY